ncbi:MAG: nuclear transport factor 2 family protein [Acidimicrobiaceae bacterium]|nr:nuclear transport factor 2 family protein [Acidimicrobiaceae bacterium]
MQWGAADASPPTCRTREQVLAWYQSGRDAGVRAQVCEIVVLGDRIVIGLSVVGYRDGDGNGDDRERWQVLTVRACRVIDIVGFDERSDAVTAASA